MYRLSDSGNTLTHYTPDGAEGASFTAKDVLASFNVCAGCAFRMRECPVIDQRVNAACIPENRPDRRNIVWIKKGGYDVFTV